MRGPRTGSTYGYHRKESKKGARVRCATKQTHQQYIKNQMLAVMKEATKREYVCMYGVPGAFWCINYVCINLVNIRQNNRWNPFFVLNPIFAILAHTLNLIS